MEMTVKPVVPDVTPNTELKRAAGPTAPPRVADPGVAPASWIGAALSSFVDMIEPVVTRLSAGKRLVAVQSPDGADLAFHLVSGRRSTAIGNSAAVPDVVLKAIKRTKMSSAELRLDPDRLATARFKIPAASSEFAPQIVESRLDRLTPWRPEAVIYGFALSNKPGPDGQLDVDLLATSRNIAEASIDHLARFGLTALALGSAEHPLTDRLRIDLFGGRKDMSRKAQRRTIGIAATALVAISLIACGTTVYSLRQTSQRIVELDATLAKARNRLVNASGSTAERDEDLSFIATKQPAEARFHLIDRLAAILPDNTYLDELDIEPGSIRLAGISTDVSSLIRLLEDDDAFRDVKFAAPVTRQEDGRDRFEITALHGAKTTDAPQ
jgi:general secretion pathway protein L